MVFAMTLVGLNPFDCYSDHLGSRIILDHSFFALDSDHFRSLKFFEYQFALHLRRLNILTNLEEDVGFTS